jgi:hypothetical protein
MRRGRRGRRAARCCSASGDVPAAASTPPAIGEEVPARLAPVLAALMHVGDPCVFARSGPGQFDCSGLTRFAWRTVGIDLVHYAVAQRQQTPDVAEADLRPAISCSGSARPVAM